jgi:hypothetical protein
VTPSGALPIGLTAIAASIVNTTLVGLVVTLGVVEFAVSEAVNVSVDVLALDTEVVPHV